MFWGFLGGLFRVYRELIVGARAAEANFILTLHASLDPDRALSHLHVADGLRDVVPLCKNSALFI